MKINKTTLIEFLNEKINSYKREIKRPYAYFQNPEGLAYDEGQIEGYEELREHIESNMTNNLLFINGRIGYYTKDLKEPYGYDSESYANLEGTVNAYNEMKLFIQTNINCDLCFKSLLDDPTEKFSNKKGKHSGKKYSICHSCQNRNDFNEVMISCGLV